jgi:hypothetical protein
MRAVVLAALFGPLVRLLLLLVAARLLLPGPAAFGLLSF